MVTFCDMRWVESMQEGVWFTPLTADHHIVSRLVPEVVSKGGGVTGSLPVALHLECIPIHQQKTTYM